MLALPDTVSGYLMSLVAEDRRPAYLMVDTEGVLQSTGGDLAAYDLGELIVGRPAADQVVFLEGMLPVGGSPVFLPCVKTGTGVPADVHIFDGAGVDCVLLLDAASYEIRHKLFQQHVNQLSLSSERFSRWADYQGAALSSVFAALDVAVLETTDERRFHFLSLVPSWFVDLWSDILSPSGEFEPDKGSPLDRFLVDAVGFWHSRESGQFASGLWEESNHDGSSVSIRASALTVGDRKVLIVEHPRTAARGHRTEPRRPPRAAVTETGSGTAAQRAFSATREVEGNFEQRTAELLRLNQLLQWELAERVKAQQQNRLMIQTLNSVTEMICIVDNDGKFNYINPSFMHVYGYAESEILGQDARILFASSRNDPALLQQIVATSKEVGWKGELWSPRKDGSEIPIALSVSPIFDERFRVVGFVGVAQDLTERKQADAVLRQKEEELQVSRRMEAIGRLAGGISHDFNNLLTVIVGYGEQVLQDLPEGSEFREEIEGIRRAGLRATQLTRKLSAFGRVQVLVPDVTDLYAVVHDMEDLVRRVVREDVEIQIVSESGLHAILADRVQLEQVVLNLVVNAREAMPFGGKLTLKLANVHLAEREIIDGFDVEPGDFVLFEVSDTGEGMDDETRLHIFEPFYTTKPGGSGLGMSTVYGIVQQSRGMISAASQVGRGTTIRVFFPRTHTAPSKKPGTESSSTPTSGSETVLVVEDDEAIRRLVRTVLVSSGYEVLAAGSVADAIRMANEYDGRIDLILTDVVMPGSTGGKLVDEVQVLRPEAKVLYMSGYLDHAAVQGRIAQHGAAFLCKPFTVQALQHKVRSVLGER